MAVHQNCHIIGITGGKGGVGKSVFAANLACALLTEMRAKVLLIDLDSKTAGDQNIITGIRPNKTVSDLANFTGSFTPQALKGLIDVHNSGLHYLAAVKSPDQTLHVNSSLFKKQLHSLSSQYQYIILDLGNDLGELQLTVMNDTSSVLVVTSPEVLVVNQTKRLLNDLVAATFPIDMFQIVVNKVSKAGIAPQIIAQNLKRPIIGSIPQDDITSMGALQRSTPFILTAQKSQLAAAYSNIVRNLTGGILQKLKVLSRPNKNISLGSSQPKNALSGKSNKSSSQNLFKKTQKQLDPITLLKMQIHKELIKEMDLKKDLTNSKGDPEKEDELRKKTQLIVTQLTDKLGQGLARDERSKIIKQVLDEALGLGALEELLADPTVTEIMVNGYERIFIEKNGKLTLSNVSFTSNEQLRKIIERIVTPLGRQINEKSPYVDARLMDGSRVNAVIEPLSIDGPVITIRKFAKEKITTDHYIKWDSLTKSMADFLRICVEQGLNIVISGGTGSGKTTLLNVMSSFIPSTERIITVEDAAELQLNQEHVVRLETRPANMEGSGEVSIRDLIKNSLRMRPDRIIVGECRDGAALDMLTAMNTGHDGSMTTLHANNPREAISRLETLCLMAGMDLPIKAIREQVAGAVNLIVQITRLGDGSRKIKNITEVVGMQGETITLQEIFAFKETGFDKNRKIIGQFQTKGLIPTFIEKFEQRGVVIPKSLFTNSKNSDSQESKKPTTPVRQIPKRMPVKKASGDS